MMYKVYYAKQQQRLQQKIILTIFICSIILYMIVNISCKQQNKYKKHSCFMQLHINMYMQSYISVHVCMYTIT